MKQLIEWSKEQKTTCLRKKVAAGLVVEGKFIIQAINGSGNKCSNEKGNCGCAHAEPKVLLAYLKKRLKLHHSYTVQLYSIYSPCSFCADIIIGSDIVSEIYYAILTEHDRRGLRLLKEAGLKCFHLPTEN